MFIDACGISSKAFVSHEQPTGEGSWILWASQVALVVKNPPANAGDKREAGSIPGLGRSPGGGHGNPLQYSCLENPIDRGAWWAIVHIHRVAELDVTEVIFTYTWISLGISCLLETHPPQTHAHLCKTQHSNLGAHKAPEALPHTLSWAELCFLKIYKVKSRSPAPQSETVFGDRVFKEVIKLK